jgi:hypothetical protein
VSPSRQEVYFGRLHIQREGSESLNGIYTEENVSLSAKLPDVLQVRPKPGQVMNPGYR